MALPALSSELPEQLRADFARIDLMTIAEHAAEQAAIQDYATQAASEVVHALSTSDVPNMETVSKLTMDYEDPTEFIDGKTNSEFARQLVEPLGKKLAGVSDQAIVRDVLSSLHPDQSGPDEADENERLFKSITEAQHNRDNLRAQNLYAQTVNLIATEANTSNPAQLELLRYKAWLAVQAGKGRFGTIAQVDAWKENELAVLPLKIRAGLLAATLDLYVMTLGANKRGHIVVPNDCFETVKQGVDSGRKAISKLLGDNVNTADLKKADLPSFDHKLKQLVEQLKLLLKTSSFIGPTWSYHFKIRVITVGETLRRAAEELQGIGDINEGKIALAGIGKYIRESRDKQENVSPIPKKGHYNNQKADFIYPLYEENNTGVQK